MRVLCIGMATDKIYLVSPAFDTKVILDSEFKRLQSMVVADVIYGLPFHTVACANRHPH